MKARFMENIIPKTSSRKPANRPTATVDKQQEQQDQQARRRKPYGKSKEKVGKRCTR